MSIQSECSRQRRPGCQTTRLPKAFIERISTPLFEVMNIFIVLFSVKFTGEPERVGRDRAPPVTYMGRMNESQVAPHIYPDHTATRRWCCSISPTTGSPPPNTRGSVFLVSIPGNLGEGEGEVRWGQLAAHFKSRSQSQLHNIAKINSYIITHRRDGTIWHQHLNGFPGGSGDYHSPQDWYIRLETPVGRNRVRRKVLVHMVERSQGHMYAPCVLQWRLVYHSRHSQSFPHAEVNHQAGSWPCLIAQ